MSSPKEEDRVCNTCKEPKPLTAFNRSSRCKLGRAYKCRECEGKYRREVYYPKLKQSPAYRERMRLAHRKYAKMYPEKMKSHDLARTHKDRLLKDACEACGSTAKRHMHHPDYSKPLEVVTLCIPCHEKVHHGGLS